MQILQRASSSASLAAELSHIFCCGLPMAAAILSTGSQVGLTGAFLSFHSITHAYEIQILVASGVLLAIGLVLQLISHRVECNQSVCRHSDCAPKKFRVSRIFAIACALFLINMIVFIFSGHATEAPRFS